MPTCPKCHRHFRVLEDEDDGQHGCPRCGYGDHDDYDDVIPEDSDTEDDYSDEDTDTDTLLSEV